jgi:hypothetical protein
MEVVDEGFNFAVGMESNDNGTSVFSTKHFSASAEGTHG